ncbi:hypothetical protein CHELA1G11_11587 [Hyphomicrobiales bacterium]|nr:hypothetical protein CHELA1G11_11587 [Hyphomicrobiales bacterium]CAH1666715.1 hypothetical protein CHELA1G2_12721 [Hyphomicrobiales bacterium]
MGKAIDDKLSIWTDCLIDRD